LRIFGPSTERAVGLDGLTGVDRILPAGNDVGLLTFLIRDAKGWHLIAAAATGSARVSTVTSIPAAADLAAPVP
jgi:hypothetical protein